MHLERSEGWKPGRGSKGKPRSCNAVTRRGVVVTKGRVTTLTLGRVRRAAEWGVTSGAKMGVETLKRAKTETTRKNKSFCAKTLTTNPLCVGERKFPPGINKNALQRYKSLYIYKM